MAVKYFKVLLKGKRYLRLCFLKCHNVPEVSSLESFVGLFHHNIAPFNQYVVILSVIGFVIDVCCMLVQNQLTKEKITHNPFDLRPPHQFLMLSFSGLLCISHK